MLDLSQSMTPCCQLGPGEDGQGPVSILDPRAGPCQGCTSRRESVARPLSGSHLGLQLLGRQRVSKSCDPPHFRLHSAGGVRTHVHAPNPASSTSRQLGGRANSTKGKPAGGGTRAQDLGLYPEPQHQNHLDSLSLEMVPSISNTYLHSGPLIIYQVSPK